MIRLPLIFTLFGIAFGLQCLSFENGNPSSAGCDSDYCYSLTINHNLGVISKGGCDAQHACHEIGSNAELNLQQLYHYFGIQLPPGVTEARWHLTCCGGNDCNPSGARRLGRLSARIIV